MAGKMVLSDELLVVYENFLINPIKYRKKYKFLMKKLILPYETNKAQLVRAKDLELNEKTYERLLPQLCHTPNKNDELSNLAITTSLKLILTEDKNAELPYLFYKSDFNTNELTTHLKKSDSRSSLTKYISLLCTNATKVTVCDNYFAENWDDTSSLFHSVLPRKTLLIEYVETGIDTINIKNSQMITQKFLHDIFPDWQLGVSNLYSGSHDRYLLIESPEGTVEIMISSGFSHIWKKSPKEITCVFREVSK